MCKLSTYHGCTIARPFSFVLDPRNTQLIINVTQRDHSESMHVSLVTLRSKRQVPSVKTRESCSFSYVCHHNRLYGTVSYFCPVRISVSLSVCLSVCQHVHKSWSFVHYSRLHFTWIRYSCVLCTASSLTSVVCLSVCLFDCPTGRYAPKATLQTGGGCVSCWRHIALLRVLSLQGNHKSPSLDSQRGLFRHLKGISLFFYFYICM